MSYRQLANHALEVLGVEEEDEEEYEEKDHPSMFRIDGARIPDSPINGLPWNVSRYLKSLRKSAGQIKVSVGYSHKLSFQLS